MRLMRELIFTPPWVEAWASELNRSQEFRQVARDWEGDLCLKMTSRNAAEQRAVYLDLAGGRCREARVATEQDQLRARVEVVETNDECFGAACS